jgi:hypothetical protein
MGWAVLVHSETGGVTVTPDDPTNLLVHEVRGWERRALPDWLDPNDPLAPAVLADRGLEWTEPILDAETVNGLKGKALDEALDEAGLPKSGSADEKRARLAEHEAALAANDTTENEGEQ